MARAERSSYTRPMTPADRPGPEDFAAVLARFAVDLSTDKLPPSALAAAKLNVFDTLACAAAGSSAAAVAETHDLAMEWGGSPQASVLVFGDRLPAHHAAWVNGTMAHARDYDDTHDAAVLHAGVSVVPAALAAAELAGGSASGADLLAGVAAGLETICRLGVATRIGIIESGFIYTPLFGYFAATVAASRVLRLDAAQTVNAIGIAYSQVAGNHQVTRDAALTKRMQPGFAAMAALVSVQLTRKGIRGAQQTFDGADGFLRVYLRGQVDRQVLVAGLGERYEFEQLSYKPYPCCRFNHSPIAAALELRARIGDPARIRQVRVGVNKQAYEAVCTPVEVRKAPTTIVQAQFSIPYTIAAALVDGGVRLGHFTDDGLRNPAILALARKVDGYVHADIEREAGRNITPAQVAIEFDDGTSCSHYLALPPGHPSKPMTPAESDAKALDCFRAAARPLPDDGHVKLRAAIDTLEHQPDARVLASLLRAAA